MDDVLFLGVWLWNLIQILMIFYLIIVIILKKPHEIPWITKQMRNCETISMKIFKNI